MLFKTEGKIPHLLFLGIHAMEYLYQHLSKTMSKDEMIKYVSNLSDEEFNEVYNSLPLGKRKKDLIDTFVHHIKEKDSNLNIKSEWLEKFLTKYINPLSEKDFRLYLSLASSKSITEDGKKDVNTMIGALISLIVCINGLDKTEFSFLPDDAFISDDQMLSLISKEEKKRITTMLDNVKTTDIVKLDHIQAFTLYNFWKNDDTPDMPADIFFSKTVPIHDLIMTVSKEDVVKANSNIDENESSDTEEKDSKNNSEISKNYLAVDIRVTIYPDYEKRVDHAIKSQGSEFTEIGAISFHEPNKIIIVPIGICAGEDCIGVSNSVAIRKIPKYEINFWLNTHDNKTFGERCRVAYKTWYGIQLSLLHPATKTVYRKDKDISELSETYSNISKTKNKQNSQNKAKYIKYNTIDLRLDHISDEPTRKNNKHCLSWRVIGHWRHYKNGKTIFIQPYWKGALKDIKNADIRNRELVLNDDNGGNFNENHS